MLHQVEDLLSVAALEAEGMKLRRAPFDVSALVRGLVEAAQPNAAANKLVLTSEVSLSDVWVDGDALRVRQVLRNLLDNAIKFTPCGSVCVRAYAGEGDDLCFEVRDSGPGIPEDRIASLMEPFVQGDSAATRRHGGVGLGLSIAQRLVRAMHGELAIESRLGVGTRVLVRLPLPAAHEVRMEVAEATAAVPANVRVLVVDDSATARELLAAMLQRFGAVALLAASGEEAMRIAAEQPVNLVLLDYHMPEADGAETAVGLRRVLSTKHGGGHVPIHLLTANVFAREQIAAGASVGARALAEQLRAFESALPSSFPDGAALRETAHLLERTREAFLA